MLLHSANALHYATHRELRDIADDIQPSLYRAFTINSLLAVILVSEGLAPCKIMVCERQTDFRMSDLGQK